MTTKSLVLLEALNVLFSGTGGHSDVLELGVSGGARVGVAEMSLKFMDEVEE